MTGQERAYERDKWVPVDVMLPGVGMTNGFWDSVPVFVALAGDRVTGAFFSYVGGDALDADADGNPLLRTPVPSFTTDEGLPHRGVTHWYPAPFHPKDLNA